MSFEPDGYLNQVYRYIYERNGEWKISAEPTKPSNIKIEYIEIDLERESLRYLNNQLEKFKDENINYDLSKFCEYSILRLAIKKTNNIFDSQIFEYEENMKRYEKEKEIMIKLNKENKFLKVNREIFKKKEELAKLEKQIEELEKTRV